MLASRKNAICDGSGKSAASHSAGRGLRPAPQSPTRRGSLSHGDAASSRVLSQGGGASSSAMPARRDAAPPCACGLRNYAPYLPSFSLSKERRDVPSRRVLCADLPPCAVVGERYRRSAVGVDGVSQGAVVVVAVRRDDSARPGARRELAVGSVVVARPLPVCVDLVGDEPRHVARGVYVTVSRHRDLVAELVIGVVNIFPTHFKCEAPSTSILHCNCAN